MKMTKLLIARLFNQFVLFHIMYVFLLQNKQKAIEIN